MKKNNLPTLIICILFVFNFANAIPTTPSKSFEINQGEVLNKEDDDSLKESKSEDEFFYIGSLPLNGVLAMSLYGSFTYSPNLDYVGDDSFSYFICRVEGSEDVEDLKKICLFREVNLKINAVENISEIPLDKTENSKKVEEEIAKEEIAKEEIKTEPIPVNNDGGVVIANPNLQTNIFSSTVINLSNNISQVLGTSTACSIYLNLRGDYLAVGHNNDKENVILLKKFLNQNLEMNLPLNSEYDIQTVNAVKKFQLKYKDIVLTPWEISSPTGIVYLTTATHINNLICPGLGLIIPKIDLLPIDSRKKYGTN
jgi:Bacterial Ig domain